MKKYISWFIAFLALVVADQLTKWWAVIALKGNDGITIIDGVFRLMYLENRGAAFGIMQNKRIILLITAILILIFLLYLFIKIPDLSKFKPLKVILVVIAAGAVGNMIDRIVHGFVTDFFYFELINFPVFNVADCYVVVSAIAAMLLILFYYKEEDLETIKNGK